MEGQLIPYSINETGEVIISARELHEFLQINTKFGVWIPRMIEYGFEENEDYNIVIQKQQTAGGPQDFRDYLLKADMAKEICMLQRTERGRQARLYFINLEKKFNSPEAILRRLMQLLDKPTSYAEGTNSIFSQNQPAYTPDTQIASDVQITPRYMISNYNCENFSDLFTNFRDTAKMFGMKENLLIGWLLINNFCYRDNYNNIRPHAKHMNYFELRPFKSPTGHSGIQTLINARGRDFFTNLLANENLIQVEYSNIL